MITHSFKSGQKVKDCFGKIVTIVGDCNEYDRSIVTTGGNYHPTKIFAIK